jgi:hypothetical protein
MDDDWFVGLGRYLIDCEPGQELLLMGREKVVLMVADDVEGREFTEYIFVDEDHIPTVSNLHHPNSITTINIPSFGQTKCVKAIVININ